jgi:hypothetical protein
MRARRQHRRRRRVGQHVLRQHDDHGPGHAGGGEVKGARRHFGDALGIADLDHQLCHVAEHALVGHFLEGAAAAVLALDLADEQQQRHRILLRRMYGDGGIAGAGAAAHQADAGPAGELGIGHRHEAGAALVPASDDLDRPPIERVEHGEIALAGDAEGAVDAMRLELGDQQAGGGKYIAAGIRRQDRPAVCSRRG